MSFTTKLVLYTTLAILALVGLSFLTNSSNAYAVIILPIGFSWGNMIMGVIYLLVGAVILVGKIGGEPTNHDLTIIDSFTDGTDIPKRRTGGYRERGRSFLIAGGILLLIGGSICLPFVGGL